MTITLTPNQVLARWRELGIEDIAVVFRLVSEGVSYDDYAAYFDAGITELVDVVRLSKRGIPGALVSQYQAEAGVSVDEVIALAVAKVVPGMLKGVLAQFPGSSIAEAIAMKSSGIGKSMLPLLAKLGIDDPEQMKEVAKKFNATDVKIWISRGATKDDFFTSDGRVTVPDTKRVILRTIGRPELRDLRIGNFSTVTEAEAAIAMFDAGRTELGLDDEAAAEFSNEWHSVYRPIPVEAAVMLHREGLHPGDYEKVQALAAKLDRYPNEVAVVYAASRGLRLSIGNRRNTDWLSSKTSEFDLLARLRQDLDGTAAWMAPLVTSSPVDTSSFGSHAKLYSGLTQCEGIQWQLDLLGKLPVEHHGLIEKWEAHYYHTLFSRSMRADASKAREQMASRITSLVEPGDYVRLADLGVPKSEMLAVRDRAKKLVFSEPIKLDDDDEPPTRPDFDWDEI